MVAYSFHQQFVGPISRLEKTHTIRKPRTGRARHVEPGGAMQLYTGPRMTPRKVGDAICDCRSKVTLDFNEDVVTVYAAPPKWNIPAAANRVSVGVIFQGETQLNFFARADGFHSWDQMRAFWQRVHHIDAQGWHWEGVIIFWRDFKPCL